MSVRWQVAPAEAGAEQAVGRESHVPPKPGSKSCGAAPCLQALYSKPELRTVCAYLCIYALSGRSLCDFIYFYCFYNCAVGASTGNIKKVRSCTWYKL